MGEVSNTQMIGGIGCLSFFAVGLVCLGMWGCPQYRVYHQEMEGRAKLREAESSRQIKVEEAKAAEHSAKMLAAAEVERAKGVAEANRIIGEGLKGNHEYLMYLWIHGVADKDHQIIYIPTEGGLPILEAGRFVQPPQPKK